MPRCFVASISSAVTLPLSPLPPPRRPLLLLATFSAAAGAEDEEDDEAAASVDGGSTLASTRRIAASASFAVVPSSRASFTGDNLNSSTSRTLTNPADSSNASVVGGRPRLRSVRDAAIKS